MDEDTAKVVPGSVDAAFAAWWEDESAETTGTNHAAAFNAWSAAVAWCAARADQIATGFSESGAPDRAYGARAVAKHLGGYK